MPLDGQSQEDARLSEEASGELWQLYVREAEQYDHGLVRSWKEDMDVTLVFSGLYSAVLSAFVVESYKNLRPDQSEASTMLLFHISKQLSTTAGEIPAATSAPFQAKISDIACNILWFLSLILALSCALLATFVQQWTRQFLHRTSITRAPTARARLISFLYFGLKDFKMHTIVDIIPSLLHLSLFAFFGGLVAFLHPINPALQWMVIGSLIIIASTYAFLTIMPVINLNSPYQTPLSLIIWRSWQSFWWLLEKFSGLRRLASGSCWGGHTEEVLPTSSPRHYNLTSAMVAASRQGRQEREYKSMSWTLKSLNDDPQFLSFLEALPNVIYGPGGKILFNNLHLVKPILETTDPDVDIISRIFCLIQQSRGYWYDDEQFKRCCKAIPNALWALAYALNRYPATFDLGKTGRSSWFTRDQLNILESTYSISMAYLISITALVESNILLCQEIDLNLSVPYSPALHSSPVFPDSRKQAEVLLHFLHKAINHLPYPFHMTTSTFHALKGHRQAQTFGTADIYESLIQRLSTIMPDEHQAPWDVICYASMQICNKDMVPVISRCLNKRMKLPVKEGARGPWIPLCQREDNHVPGYVPFLRAVIANGEYIDDCVRALRDVIWSFDKPLEHWANIPCADPRWWTRLEPTWLKVLSDVEAQLSQSINQPSSPLLSLAIMIKGMVLKKTYPPPPPEEKVDFNLANFISTHISDSISVEPSPTFKTVKTSFLVLVLEQLECIDPDEPKSIATAENTLRFLECDDLRGVAYVVDSEFTQRLASQTRRCSELWRSDPSSSDLATILHYTWTLWEEVDRLPAVRRDKISIPEEVASDIVQAADIIIGSGPGAVDNLLTSEVPKSTDKDSNDAGNESDDADDEPDTDSESENLPFSESSLKLIERVKAIKETWDIPKIKLKTEVCSVPSAEIREPEDGATV